MSRQFISGEEAEVATRQHTHPCSDCPWSRKSIGGWLGALTAQEWLQVAHGEGTAECHTLLGAQCAGLATYRANICKSPRRPEALRLKADRGSVFASPSEFTAHHHGD